MADGDRARGSGPAERTEDFIDRFLDDLDLDADATVTEDDEGLHVDIDGEDLGLLIGRRGQTIDAVEHLAQRIAFRGEPARKRLVVDVAGYRERRAAALRRDADAAVRTATTRGEAVRLEAMSSPERRVVHEYLRDVRDIDTHSEGDEPQRRIVVTPVAE